MGLASESGLILVEVNGSDLVTLLTELDAHQAGGKQVLGRADGQASVVLSLENLHDFPRLQERLRARFGAGLRLSQGLGAVSAIGAGINASFENFRKSLDVLDRLGISPAAVSTSAFRISLLLPEAKVQETVRHLHAALVRDDLTVPPPD